MKEIRTLRSEIIATETTDDFRAHESWALLTVKHGIFFLKIQETVERMVQGQQLKFERNPCIRFRDNFDMDGRGTEYRRMTMTNFDFMNSADIVKQN